MLSTLHHAVTPRSIQPLLCRFFRDLLVEKSIQQKAGADTLTEIDVDIPLEYLCTLVRGTLNDLFCFASTFPLISSLDPPQPKATVSVLWCGHDMHKDK